MDYRECGDGGVEERGERLAIDDLALGVDVQVPPSDLDRGLPHADPVHPAALVPEQAEVVLVDVGDEGVHQLPPVRGPQPAHVHRLQRMNGVGMERERGVEPVPGGQPLAGRPFQLDLLIVMLLSQGRRGGGDESVGLL